jgi:hypothetical protein
MGLPSFVGSKQNRPSNPCTCGGMSPHCSWKYHRESQRTVEGKQDMGIGPRFGMSGDTGNLTTGNPDPFKFSVVKRYQEGVFSALQVHYPDCKNFEGNKILVFNDSEELDKKLTSKNLDPHFFEGSALLARFAPTKEGWKRAVQLVKDLASET